MQKNKVFIRYQGLKSYESIFKKMHEFTDLRNENTSDEVWLVEHFPIFTKGQTGKTEHLLIDNDIPIIQSDRGGKITYHGPGQQIVYILLDLKRRKLRIRQLIKLIEKTVIDTLATYRIDAYARVDAPGIYVGEKKICSLGLKISKGCSLHGFALNVNMDLSPFTRINPCGYFGMKMTQMCYWDMTLTTNIVRPQLIKHFLISLKNPPYEYMSI